MRLLILLFAALPVVAQVDPQGIVSSVAAGDITPDEAATRLATILGVSDDSARAYTLATLPLTQLQSGIWLDGEERERSLAVLTEALKREPNRAPLIAAYALVATSSAEPDAAATAMLPLIGDDVRAALAAAGAVGEQRSLIFLAHAYAHAPENVEVRRAIGRVYTSSFVHAAIGPFRITPTGVELLDPAADNDAIATQLHSIGVLGLPDLFLAAFESLPPEKQQAFMVQSSDLTDDARTDVVMAALLAGRPELAERWAPLLRPDPDDRRDKATRLLLAASLPGASADPFDVIVARFREGLSSPGAGLTSQLVARFAAQHGYHDLATEVLADMSWVRTVPEDVEGLFRDAIAVVQGYIDVAGALPPTPSREAVAPSSLAAPRIVPFTVAENGGDVATPPGSDLFAVALSKSTDGYWIRHSSDGGVTWREYYTGLREARPYVIEAGAQPLLDGDRLRVVADDADLDFSWAALTRDSDGDGLTDLLEESLTTDPNAVDTDGDGSADGEDNLPRVPASSTGTVASAVLSEALRGFRAVIESVREREDGVEALQQIRETLFVVGDPAQFAPLTMDRRTIVLTAAEAEAWAAKFDPMVFAEIRHFVIDPSGTRALIEVDGPSAGVIYLMKKTSEGRWNVTVLDVWGV